MNRLVTLIVKFSVKRLLYFLAGILFVAIAFIDDVWWMAICGLYFILMSIFKLGCASGNCGVNFEPSDVKNNSTKSI